jgi:GntR family transcriptional regulator / MocR family aminotransferase
VSASTSAAVWVQHNKANNNGVKQVAKDLSGIAPVIAIDRLDTLPLHHQICEGFRAAILRGDLRPGQQVPSTRHLAEDLEVSRFPVLGAYERLLSEGYFESRVGSGTFVSASLPGKLQQARRSRTTTGGSRCLSRRSSLLPRFEPVPWRYGSGPFGVHQPALDQFPFAAWSKLLAEHGRRPRLRAIHDNDPMGLDRFRDAICSYLHTARAVECDPSQIMIVSGSQQALEITARVLLDPGDPVWIEEPGYPLAQSVLLGAGCRIVPVPVDDEGINVSAGMNLLPKARAAFVTPSHQYPLGVTMSASRRLHLLDWARDNGAWVVEDDYDSAYRYDTTSVSSLQGIDSDARVIYIGTFSRVIFPSVRVSYIVIPPDLMERFMAVRFSLGICPSCLFQEVLTDFIRAGQFARHIRRMRALYKERRTALVESVQNTCSDILEIHGAGAGMHLTVTLPSGFNDIEIASQGVKYGLCLWPLSPCYLNKPRHGFMLGFAATPADQMAGAVHQLSRLLKKQPGPS